MRRYACLFVLALSTPAAAAGPDLEEAGRIIVRRANELRLEAGLPKVAPDAALAGAARSFADHMARTDDYGHAADGTQPAERAAARGYDYCLVSENIAYQFSTEPYTTADLARRYVEGWKDSPGHRRNMLEPGATDTGAAVARSPRTGRYYAVQMFGRPRSRSIEFRVANLARSAVRYRMGRDEFSLGPGQERIHTACTPEELTFPAAASGEGRTIRPSDGDRLRVEGDRRLRVRVSR